MDTAQAMSSENVDALRAVYDEWGKGNLRAGVDLYDRHVLLVLSPEFPDAGTYLGIEAVAAYTRGLLEAWEVFSIEAEEIVPAGDSVLAALCQRGVGGASGAATEFRYFMLWTFRGGRVIRIESIRERAEALEVAGLGE